MEIIKTNIEGLLVIQPRVFADARGFFFESYNEKLYREAGIDTRFCQDNQSKSGYGVIRGLHYQLNPHSQSKLFRLYRCCVGCGSGFAQKFTHFRTVVRSGTYRRESYAVSHSTGFCTWFFGVERNSGFLVQMRRFLQSIA